MKIKILSATLLILLQACGGGGSDSPNTPAPAATYDLNGMQATLVTSSQSFTVSATNGADAYQMFLSTLPAPDAIFEGSIRKRATQSITLRKNGATAAATTFAGYYGVTNFQLVGAQYAGGEYLLATTPSTALPTAAKVGANGSLGTQTLYADSTKTTVLATQQATWTLEASTSGSASYCVNTVLTDTSSKVIATTVGCYRISDNGAVLGIRWVIAVDGPTLTFQ